MPRKIKEKPINKKNIATIMIAINKISKFAARRHKMANEEISIVEIFSLINKIKSNQIKIALVMKVH